MALSEDIGERYADRHEATRHLLRTLRPNPNLTGKAADLARHIWSTACLMVDGLGDGPELSAGLRKLREAKDCFVLQSLSDNLHIK